MASFGFGFPSLSFSPRKQQKKPSPGISKALHSSSSFMSDVGVGITTQLRIQNRTTLKKAARAVGHQPFDLSGKRRPQAPEPVDRFRHKVKQVSHQPFLKGAPAPVITPQDKFVKRAQQVSNQPFKLVVTPPKAAPSEIFAMRANQLAHQPFKMGAAKQLPMSKFKRKAKSIGQLSAHPLFRHVLTEERQNKVGRFKSISHAIIRTARMFNTTEAIKHAARMEDDMIGSNKDAIRSGKHPLLKKEVLTLLFEYLPVPDLKTARVVCEFWKRFATVTLQKKSRVKLTGICDLCKSEWMSQDDSIPAHEHAETISFYRFVLFIQDIPEEHRYFMPFRNFKIKNLNLYFIRGINTAPTRVFLMFLKLWGEKIHELHLQGIQMTPPDAFYRIVDCCKRVRSFTFDDIRVWLDPLAESTDTAKFSMHINYYVESITFVTNWIGEELLHWQMIFQAFPSLKELNLIDVAKTEINHCLIALLNLPEEEEEIALRSVGGFKLLSRKVMRIPFKLKYDDSQKESLPSFKTVSRLLVDMPFAAQRMKKLQALQEDEPNKFKKFAQKLHSQPFQLSPREKAIPTVIPGRLKGIGRQLIQQPFRVAPKPVSQVPGVAKSAGGKKLKGFAAKVGRQPFGLGKPSGPVPEDGSCPEAVSDSADENVQTEEAKAKAILQAKVLKGLKKKSLMNQPFRLPSKKDEEAQKKKKEEQPHFRARARAIINQPFILINPTPELTPEVFQPKPKTFKGQIGKMINQPFQIVKPKIKPLDRFRMVAKKVGNQPFNLGEPVPHEKVCPGSILYKINVSSRRSYEDHLKAELEAREREMNENEENEENEDSDSNDDIEIDEEEEDDSEVSESDNQSTIQDSDFNEMETNELVAEVVHRFKITHVTLRVNYTAEDASTFPLVLEACREKVTSITLTRHSKVYFSELDLKFLVNPFETPEETVLDFPKVTKLSIAHNIVGHINEIQKSFPSLIDLTINVVTTEFLQIKNKPYKTYVRTNMILSMKFGKSMPTVKNLVWNIQESRHPFTQKRTLVYKCNALLYVPRIFPSLSKLTVSITTAHELHVIFGQCIQLHDLIILKNSFYRTKDEDIIGQDEIEEERQKLLGELDPDKQVDPAAKRARSLHPTIPINHGIKQLKYLRRLSLENNNCCLTNQSVEHGFIHLRRLRSIHISRCKRIEQRALRLLKRCRFLVRVSITKEKVKAQIPIRLEGEDNDENENQLRLPPLSAQVHSIPGYPNMYIFQSPLTDAKYIAKPQGGFQAYTKYDKIGGKRFDFVTTPYEVNGRQYRLIRRNYEGQPYNNEVWERKFRLAELKQREEDALKEIEDLERSAEIDPVEMIHRAEKKRLEEVKDEESDYERFMNEYDDDYEDDEEGYCDEDDDLLQEEKQRIEEEEEESSDEDGICPEADTMYEGDKEHYEDTDPKSSDGESYCDTPTEGEYQADKETCDASDEAGKEGSKAEDKADKGGEMEEGSPEQAKTEQGIPEEAKPEEVGKVGPEKESPCGISPPEEDKPEDTSNPTPGTTQEAPSSSTKEEPPSIEEKSCIATVGSSCEKEILERTSQELLRNLKEVAAKQLRAKERAKEKAKKKDITEGAMKEEKKKKPKEKSDRKGKSKKAIETKSNALQTKLEHDKDMSAVKKVLTWNTEETRDIEYMESLRTVSLSRHGPCHMSPVPVPGSHPYQPYDQYHDSTATSEAGTSASCSKAAKKDKKSKSRRHSKDSENLDEKKLRKRILEGSDGSQKKSKSRDKISREKREKSESRERVRKPKSGRNSPQAAPVEVLGDLRQQLIKKMVSDVKKEMKK